jgi:hypothetical protein
MIHEASQLFSKMQEEGIKPGKVKLKIFVNYIFKTQVYNRYCRINLFKNLSYIAAQIMTYFPLNRKACFTLVVFK